MHFFIVKKEKLYKNYNEWSVWRASTGTERMPVQGNLTDMNPSKIPAPYCAATRTTLQLKSDSRAWNCKTRTFSNLEGAEPQAPFPWFRTWLTARGQPAAVTTTVQEQDMTISTEVLENRITVKPCKLGQAESPIRSSGAERIRWWHLNTRQDLGITEQLSNKKFEWLKFWKAWKSQIKWHGSWTELDPLFE